MIVLSPEVREFCEENNRKIAGKAPRFQTMADAWVFLILHGIKSGRESAGPMKKTKDAFRWRTVNSNFQAPLLLRSILRLELPIEALTKRNDDESVNWTQILRLLEMWAHVGVLELRDQ